MPVNIGIPNALLYHEFGKFWTTFFNHLRIPITLSEETNKQILHCGTTLAIDESCLPLKIYLGHIASLLPICTHIFVPRIAGYHKHFFLCAKFSGLPDIVKNTFHLTNKQLITPNIEDNHYSTQLKAISTTCSAINTSKVSGCLAYYQTKKEWKLRSQYLDFPNAKIALIGHSYLIKDSFFSYDILTLLEKHNLKVITPEQIPSKTLYQYAASFHSDIYWQLSAKIAGATQLFSQHPDIKGIIMISSFCCAPDSLINEYLEHHILKKSSKPYIQVTIDEHTGCAGIVTRIEAFLDLLDWRIQSCK